MKKLIFVVLAMMCLSLSMVSADECVSFEVEENETNSSYTVNINIQITGNDTYLRQDVYGTSHSSSPRDKLLEGAEVDNETKLKDVCEQPQLQQYFDEVGDLPPAGFVKELKAMGYDDETHINFIWNLCQHEYIKKHESEWLRDKGISSNSLVSLVRESVDWLISVTNHWLNNGNTEIIDASEEAKELGSNLDRYFASDWEVYLLQQQINDLNIRVRALEKAMDKIAAEAYCQGKIDTMFEYNLSWVKCGENSTYYYRVDPKEWNGKEVIGITPVSPTPKIVIPRYTNISIISFNVSKLEVGKNATAILIIKNFGNLAGNATVYLEVPEGIEYEPKQINVLLQPNEEKELRFTLFVKKGKGTASITGYLTYLLNQKIQKKSKMVEVKIKEVKPVVQTFPLTGYFLLGRINNPFFFLQKFWRVFPPKIFFQNFLTE